MDKYRCILCEFRYDAKIGDNKGGISAGTIFENIPDNWVCPECGTGKSNFRKIEFQNDLSHKSLNITNILEEIVVFLIIPFILIWKIAGFCFLMSGIGLIIFQAYLWIQYGAWPEWPLSYLFINPMSHITNTLTGEQEINATLSILKLTPSFFYEFFNNSWLSNPNSLYGLHGLTVNFLDLVSLPVLLLITGFIMTTER